MDVQGTVAAGFEPVRDAFIAQLRAARRAGRGGRRLPGRAQGRRPVGRHEGRGRRRTRGRVDTAQIVRSATQGHRRRRTAAAAPARPAGPGRAGRHVLARVQGRRQGTRPRPPPARAPGRGARPRPPADPRRRPPTAIIRRRGRRRAGARLGAGHRPRLPRADLQLAHRRAGAPRHRAHRRPLDRRGDSRARSAWTSGSGCPTAEAHRVGPDRPGRAARPPGPGGACGIRPKRSVAEAYRDPDSLTRRAFGAIDPAARRERPRLPGGRTPRLQRHRAPPAPWPAATPR